MPDWNPSAGGIRAFYFRDPDRHVLEVIWFPAGKGAPRWQRHAPTALFLGIDHTAIVVADTDEEKERVREVVRNLTDHLIQNDFCLVDHDGKPTRWAVYGPQELNHNPLWWIERGLKSLSMLSYLTVAAHVTGDHKYSAAARELVHREGYGPISTRGVSRSPARSSAGGTSSPGSPDSFRVSPLARRSS